MDKSLAQSLGLLVNSRQHYHPLQNYVDSRIEYYKNQMVCATSWEHVKHCQGAIEALKQIKTLKEQAESELKERGII